MIQKIPEPQKKISKKAINVWRVTDFIQNLIGLIIIGGLIFSFHYFNWVHWVGIILYMLLGLVVIIMIYELTIRPVLLQKTWRYDIDENYIQLKYGFINKYSLIIPMSRVEYVNTNQGPILRHYDLSVLTIGTITSANAIPAIPVAEAQEIRELIIHLAELESNESPITYSPNEELGDE